jgi:hypothetical protein
VRRQAKRHAIAAPGGEAQIQRAMLLNDSSFDPNPLRRARDLLAAPVRPEPLAAVAAAAALFAVSALALATIVVMLPTPWPK